MKQQALNGQRRDRQPRRTQLRAGRWWLIGAWSLLVLATASMGVRGIRRGALEAIDFSLFYCSSRAWLEGTDPYDSVNLNRIADGSSGVLPRLSLGNSIYPSFVFVVMSPFAGMSWPGARLLWLTLNLVLWAAAALVLIRLGQLTVDWRSPPFVLFLALWIGLAAVQTSIGYGQLASAATALMVAALRMNQLERQLPAALLFALAALLKPQLVAIYGLYWLLRRRWRILVTASVIGLVVWMISIGRLQLHVPGWFESWRGSIDRCFDLGPCDYANPLHGYVFINLQYPLYTLFGGRFAAQAGAWLAFSVLLAWGIVVDRQTPAHNRDELLAVSYFGTIGLLPVYHIHYDGSILVLPAAWACSRLQRSQHGPALMMALLCVPLLVPGQSILARLLGEQHDLPPALRLLTWMAMPYQVYSILAVAVLLGWAMRARSESLSRERQEAAAHAADQFATVAQASGSVK